MKNALPLLMVPGSLCDERLFAPQLDYFLPRRPTIVGEFSGCDSIACMAEKILREAPPRFALAGLSMGGIIAFEIYRQAADRVEGLALIDTNFRKDRPEQTLVRRQQVDLVRLGGMPVLEEMVAEELFPRYLSPTCTRRKEIKALVISMAKRAGPRGFSDQWQALMGRVDSRQTLSDMNCPVLIVAGAEDCLCDANLHRDMAKLVPDAQLHLLPKCGHFATLEQPAQVNLLLDKWLQELDLTTSKPDVKYARKKSA